MNFYYYLYYIIFIYINIYEWCMLAHRFCFAIRFALYNYKNNPLFLLLRRSFSPTDRPLLTEFLAKKHTHFNVVS